MKIFKKVSTLKAALIGIAVLSLLNACSDKVSSPDGDPAFEEYIFLSSDYLNNRIFRVDLPESLYSPVHDVPGRNPDDVHIHLGSVEVFRLLDQAIPDANDVNNIAAYVDTTGIFWNTDDSPTQDFSAPYYLGAHWRRLNFEVMLDVEGELVAIDLGTPVSSEDVLAVVYELRDNEGNLVHRVGDRPGIDEDNRISLPGEDGLFYRMKILKAPEERHNSFVFNYELRNVYYLGGQNIDVTNFDLKIERVDESSNPDLDERGIPYIQLFGLDRDNQEHTGSPDGMVDLSDAGLFLMSRGLLRFPLDFPTPFAAGEDAYRNYADGDEFQWEGSFLGDHQAHQLYDAEIPAQDYPSYGYFRFVVMNLATGENN